MSDISCLDCVLTRNVTIKKQLISKSKLVVGERIKNDDTVMSTLVVDRRKYSTCVIYDAFLIFYIYTQTIFRISSECFREIMNITKKANQNTIHYLFI